MEPEVIFVAAAAFGMLTWLLFLSFVLGRYAARVDGLDVQQSAVAIKLDAIGIKLDAIAISSIHQCIQVERITRLEARLPE